MERSQRAERCAEGIAKAKLRGVYKGRPGHPPESKSTFLAKPKAKKIARLLREKKTGREVATLANASRHTVAKVRRLMLVGFGEDGNHYDIGPVSPVSRS